MICRLPESVHEALVSDQVRAYLPERQPAKRPPMPFADRVRMHPRAVDLFTAKGHYEKIWFEVEFVSTPWVFYRKWSPDHPLRQNCKVMLGAWRDNLAKAQIEKVEA